jgi:hypothetical protein
MSSNDRENEQMTSTPHTRAGDPPVKITREIPLPWLLTLVGTIIGLAATVYFTQQWQGTQLGALTQSVDKLALKIDASNTAIIELKADVRDHERRLGRLEKGERP